jgi:hypothetical protein
MGNIVTDSEDPCGEHDAYLCQKLAVTDAWVKDCCCDFRYTLYFGI